MSCALSSSFCIVASSFSSSSISSSFSSRTLVSSSTCPWKSSLYCFSFLFSCKYISAFLCSNSKRIVDWFRSDSVSVKRLCFSSSFRFKSAISYFVLALTYPAPNVPLSLKLLLSVTLFSYSLSSSSFISSSSYSCFMTLSRSLALFWAKVIWSVTRLFSSYSTW